MMHSKQSKVSRLLAGSTLLAFMIFAVYLYCYTVTEKFYSEAQIARDMMWLDAWLLAFMITLLAVVLSKFRWKHRALLAVTALSVYGFIAANLMLNGTPFGFNAFWGDQTFRQAMILKFMTVGWFGDFFYNGLPMFYPPVFYGLVSLWGRLFSVEAFELLKTGSLLIYLVFPYILYYAWSRLVSPRRAFFITVSCLLICAFARATPFTSPPAFLGNLLFVPWWLFYIEQVKRPVANWKYYVGGGLIGSVIFATYPYCFFIGGLLWVLKSICWTRRKASAACSAERGPLRGWSVLVLSAVASSWYWGPALLSVIQFGSKPSDQEWYHLGHPGLPFPFLELSLIGALSVAGIAYAMCRRSTRLFRGLLHLLAVTLLFYMVGSILGALDHPVNVPKSTEFMRFMLGPLVGLAVVGVWRICRHQPGMRTVMLVVASLSLLVFLNQFNSLTRGGLVKKARSATLPTFAFGPNETSVKGAVFLAANPLLPAFRPVYTFIATNQHYSHPASRFMQRYELLYLLQGIEEPRLFNLALRYNIFDKVDYFWPKYDDAQLVLSVLLSNYPNRSYLKTLKFSPRVVSDPKLFDRRNSDHLYALKDWPPEYYRAHWSRTFGSTSDSVKQVFRLLLIENSLNEVGRRRLEALTGYDGSEWVDLNADEPSFEFDKNLSLCAARSVTVVDSTYLLLAIRIDLDINKDYKLFLHLYGQSGEETFYNFDFWPQERTTSWKKGDIVLCCRAFPTPPESCKFIVGFFEGDTRMGRAFNGYLPGP